LGKKLSEKIIMQSSGVKKHDSESPPTMGLKAGAFADVGTLILTNQRLIYVEKGGAERSADGLLEAHLQRQPLKKAFPKQK